MAVVVSVKVTRPRSQHGQRGLGRERERTVISFDSLLEHGMFLHASLLTPPPPPQQQQQQPASCLRSFVELLVVDLHNKPWTARSVRNLETPPRARVVAHTMGANRRARGSCKTKEYRAVVLLYWLHFLFGTSEDPGNWVALATDPAGQSSHLLGPQYRGAHCLSRFEFGAHALADQWKYRLSTLPSLSLPFTSLSPNSGSRLVRVSLLQSCCLLRAFW